MFYFSKNVRFNLDYILNILFDSGACYFHSIYKIYDLQFFNQKYRLICLTILLVLRFHFPILTVFTGVENIFCFRYEEGACICTIVTLQRRFPVQDGYDMISLFMRSDT